MSDVLAKVYGSVDRVGKVGMLACSSQDSYVPFPTRALPDVVSEFVDAGSDAIGCDASFLALPLMSAIASAIGTTFRIRIKGNWHEPAVLWTAIIGESGTTKSPAIETALRPVRARQSEAMRQHATQMEDHKADVLIYERALAAWKRSEEGDPPVEPEEPSACRYVIDDTTTEALLGLLQHNPRGLLMAKDELAGWIASFDKYTSGRGSDSARWLEMHGGRPICVDRKSGGVISVGMPQVCITGGVQPEILKRSLRNEHKENGLSARFLFAYPPRQTKQWNEREIPAEIEQAVNGMFDRLYELEPNVGYDEGDQRPHVVSLSADAKAAWIQFYNDHAQQGSVLVGEQAAAWSKLEAYAARFALMIHLARWATGDPTVPEPLSEVDSQSIQSGVELARWFGRESKRVIDLLGEDPAATEARRLTEWVERQGGSVKPRDLQQRSKSKYPSAEAAREALQSLVDKGIGSWDCDSTKRVFMLLSCQHANMPTSA